MQTTLIITFLVICVTYASDYPKDYESDTSIVQGIIVIQPKSIYIYEIIKPWKRIIQNIGTVNVIVKKSTSLISETVKPCEKKEIKFQSSIFTNISLNIANKDEKNRAIIYLSNMNESDITGPEDDDRNNVLKQTFTLDARYIPKENQTLDTLVSKFWPANEKNVWEKIFGVIQELFNLNEQKVISKMIRDNIGDVKNKIDKFKNGTQNNDMNLLSLYNEVNESIVRSEKEFNSKFSNKFDSKPMHYFYLLPIYSNIITLKMYFYALGATQAEMFNFPIEQKDIIKLAARYTLNNNNNSAITYIRHMQNAVFNEMYETVYAPELYNVMINAYNYLTFHGLEMMTIWKELHCKIFNYRICIVITNPCRRRAISYSNFYGRATPDLLQQAIHIEKSSLIAHDEYHCMAQDLDAISFNITMGSVCGLQLKFSEFTTTLGTFNNDDNENWDILQLYNRKITKLNVYKIETIKCLEFTLSDDSNTSIMFGNCTPNSKDFEEFQLKDHYISSIYLANDYAGTGDYFDNVAVSFLRNPLEDN